MRDELRFIRSYVVHEDDGTFSAFCVYEASGPEVLERYSEAMRLPTDAIKPVATTVVNAAPRRPRVTLGALLAARRGALIGRERELAALRELLR